MRQVTVTEKYRAVLEGNMAKGEFVRQMRLAHPQHITQFNGFDDSVQILKNRGLLFEEKKEKVEEAKKAEYAEDCLPYSDEAFQRGIRYELEAKGVEVHAGSNITLEDYDAAKDAADKHLSKDPMHYLNLLSGESSKVDKHDKEVEVKRGEGKVDVFNGLKKSDLRENKEELKTLLKEGKMSDLAEKLGIEVGKLQAAADRLREMEREDAAETAGKVEAMKSIIDEEPDEVMNIDRFGKEKEDKESNYTKVKEGDGNIVDEHEHQFFKIAFEGKYDDILEDYMSSSTYKEDERELQDKYDVSSAHDVKFLDEWDNYIKEYEAINRSDAADTYNFEAKGKDHDGDGDIDKDDYMAAKDKAIKKAMGKEPQQEIDTSAAKASLAKFAAREKELDRQNPNRHKEAGAKAAAARDAARAAKKKGGNNTARFTSFYNKEEKLKEAIKKLVKESLLKEAATAKLSDIGDKYGDYKGMQVVINDLENIVTDMEGYFAKTRERVQSAMDKIGQIETPDGMKVGAFLAPAIETAFFKDLNPVRKLSHRDIKLPQVKVARFDDLQREAEAEIAPKETVFGVNEKK